jgi:hypothetical protein
MNRFILSILSLVVAVGVGACNKQPDPRKPVPGPKTTETKETPRDVDDGYTEPVEKKKRDEVVDVTPAEKKKIPDAPVKQNPDYAIKADKPGYVKSPYDPQGRLIDVRGLPPGTEAECPYTRRTFLVPP